MPINANMTDAPATGGIPSEQDYRDQIAASAVSIPRLVIPQTYETATAPPMMQAHIPSCVAHSVVDNLKIWWFRKTGNWVDFSPRFLDILSAEDWIPQDGGRVPRTVLKMLAKYGCCTTKTLPNDTNLSIAEYRQLSAISQAALDEAKQYKIQGYVRIPVEFTRTREAIQAFGSLTTLFTIGEELWVPSWNAVDTNPLRTPKVVVSGHMMTPYGWSTDSLNLLQNQWSEAWATKGRTHYDERAWEPFTVEQWAIASIPADVQSLLSTLPSRADFKYQWTASMKAGDTSEDIKFAQIAFMILGFMKVVAPDELGIFGAKTAAANLQYQRSRGITPLAPNNIGPKTRAALNAQFSL